MRAVGGGVNRNPNRRELLRGGAGLAVAAGLAGCGVGNIERGSLAETEKPIKKQVDGDLVYFNYSEYIDPELVTGFEKRYGVSVRESYFDSMSAMMAKLRAGIAYDVIFPSGEYVQRLRAGNLLRRIDRDKIKNIDTVYSYFADPWYRQGIRAQHAVWDVRHRPRLPRRQGDGHDGLLARPRRGGLGRQELPTRRLPGGHRHGEPGERLSAQRGRH
jgi:hypothetical protein